MRRPSPQAPEDPEKAARLARIYRNIGYVALFGAAFLLIGSLASGIPWRKFKGVLPPVILLTLLGLSLVLDRRRGSEEPADATEQDGE